VQVTPAIVTFMAENPDVSVWLDLNDAKLGEGYDVAVIVGPSAGLDPDRPSARAGTVCRLRRGVLSRASWHSSTSGCSRK
jgi:hypothetical protein